jgi:hypothetical protein
MKHLIVLVSLFFAVAAFADDAPPVSARQALDAAEKNMQERGLGKDLYIESVSLSHALMFGGETYWLVKWSHPLPASTPNSHEIGLKVTMDGKIFRFVKALGKP